MNNKIDKIFSEEIQDSRGGPTIKVTVYSGSYSASFAVPSGASTGIHEAHELRDADGRGVKNAIEKVNKVITEILVGKDILNQKEIDRIMIELDGTPNKDNLGANAIIGVSIACAKVAAKINHQQVYQYLQTLMTIKPSRKIPYLFMNLIEGGKHANNGLAFQEYHIVPQVESATEAINLGIIIQNTLKELIVKDLGTESVSLGDEGGLALKINDIKMPLVYLKQALEQNNLQDQVCLSLDVAASSFYKNNFYQIDGRAISKKELMDIYNSLTKEFNLFSIEDPFYEEDFESFQELKNQNKNLLVVGDDLTVSNQTLLKKAISQGSINAMIIKPNQIGTLTETLETMKLARENNIELIVSHRGEETEDDFIADLAYAFGCFGLKSGAFTKSERMVKYQRLIQIS